MAPGCGCPPAAGTKRSLMGAIRVPDCPSSRFGHRRRCSGRTREGRAKTGALSRVDLASPRSIGGGGIALGRRARGGGLRPGDLPARLGSLRSAPRRRRGFSLALPDPAHRGQRAAPDPLAAAGARLHHRVGRGARGDGREIPEEFAEAVELHDVHGLKYREIARITSAPIGTVMSRISRGRRLLAGLLAVEGDERAKRELAT